MFSIDQTEKYITKMRRNIWFFVEYAENTCRYSQSVKRYNLKIGQEILERRKNFDLAYRKKIQIHSLAVIKLHCTSNYFFFKLYGKTNVTDEKKTVFFLLLLFSCSL